jgi:hypothetical protein
MLMEWSEDITKAIVDCLVWLSRGRFIEDEVSDTHMDMVIAYENDNNIHLPEETRTELYDFLYWMDGGDRLYRIGPDNPYGVNIQFNANDYSSDGDKSRVVVCAEDMVKYYKEEMHY